MKRFPFILVLLLGVCFGIASCGDDEKKDSWREANDKWFQEQINRKEDGRNYYKMVTAPWDNRGQVLIHWFNDTMLTKDNLRPLYSSTVDLKYIGRIYDGTPFDSSFLNKTPADSIFRCTLNGDLIEGWALAVTQMHVGDSCKIIIPYNLGYGSTSRGTVIKAYSMLEFDIKLVDIYRYERKSDR